MPVYVYRCLECQGIIEQKRSMTEPGLESCACGGQVNRVYQANPVLFKAHGFYKTDNAGL